MGDTAEDVRRHGADCGLAMGTGNGDGVSLTRDDAEYLSPLVDAVTVVPEVVEQDVILRDGRGVDNQNPVILRGSEKSTGSESMLSSYVTAATLICQ
jgi:hypothetical protein